MDACPGPRFAPISCCPCTRNRANNTYSDIFPVTPRCARSPYFLMYFVTRIGAFRISYPSTVDLGPRGQLMRFRISCAQDIDNRNPVNEQGIRN